MRRLIIAIIILSFASSSVLVAQEEQTAKQAAEREAVLSIRDVATAYAAYRDANKAVRDAFLDVLVEHLDKQTNAGNLDAVKAIQQEIDFLGNSEFELIAGEYRTQPVPSRRKRLENAYIKNQKQFIADLKTVVSELTKNRDFPNAERVQNFIDSDPLCTSSPGPWLYLFDGTEESFRKNWCYNYFFEEKFNSNHAISSGYETYAYLTSKESFEDFVLEVIYVPSDSPAETISICVRNINQVNPCNGLRLFLQNNADYLKLTTYNLLETCNPIKKVDLIPCVPCKLLFVVKSNSIKIYINQELIHDIVVADKNGEHNQGGILLQGGWFTKVRLYKL